MKNLNTLALLSVLLLAGCGDSGETSSGAASAASQSASAEATSPESFVETVDGVTTVLITGNDRMKYNLESFAVTSGDQVRVVFKNVGSMPKAAMGHNVVFLQSGVDANAYVTAAAKARDNDYIPQGMEEQVVAYTKMLGPGEEDVIEFTAPAPGVYPFVCSFPAHCFAGMVGVMEVKARAE